jgi:hypothetical protein
MKTVSDYPNGCRVYPIGAKLLGAETYGWDAGDETVEYPDRDPEGKVESLQADRLRTVAIRKCPPMF